MDWDLAGIDWDMQGDDDELGFAAARMIRAQQARSRGSARVPARAVAALARRAQTYKAALVPPIPGTPATGQRQYPLGFGTFIFTNGGATSGQLVATPQRPFKGVRLVVDEVRSDGSGGLVTIGALSVGQNNQLVSASALPSRAFAPGAFGTDLDLDPATPGIQIVLDLNITAAPSVGETVAVSAMLVGYSFS